MRPFRVHIIHVGHMANKGTQALLMTDVSVLRRLTKGNVVISVSTTDVDGVKRLSVPIDSVLPTLVDIPYETADHHARRLGIDRKGVRYKAFALASLCNMFVQVFLSVVSTMMVKAGLKGIYRSDVFGRIKDSDVVVTCSDENFKESASLLPLNIYWVLTWWSMLASKTWEVLVAKILGKSVVMFPNSVGPFRTAIGRAVSRVALNNYDFVLVREPVSYAIVRALDVKARAILTSDTTLLFNSPGYSSDRELTVGVSPGIYGKSLPERKIHDYVLAHARALDAAIEKLGFCVVFLPHYVRGFRYDDLEICKLIIDKMKNSDKARLVEADDVDEFKSWINRMDMIISSKMHPAVFAVAANIPAVFVAYDHKQTGFAASLGLRDCVVALSDLSYEKLLAKIEYVWNRKGEFRALLGARIPELKRDVEDSIASVMTRYIPTD